MVLPARHRMRRREDFLVTSRRGRRAAGRTLVVHLLGAPPVDARMSSGDGAGRQSTRVGFVVGRSVGGSVVRHAVVRRLRAVARDRLTRLPEGSRLVVRALPASATATSAELSADVDAALDRLLPRERE